MGRCERCGISISEVIGVVWNFDRRCARDGPGAECGRSFFCDFDCNGKSVDDDL